MATIDDQAPARRPDPFDILWIIIVKLFLLGVGLLLLLLFGMVVAEFGMAGWTIGGRIGLILWVPLGIATIVAALAVVAAGLWMTAWAIVYVFSLDQGPGARKVKIEFDELQGPPVPAFWPPAPYRAIAIIVITMVLWAIYAPPALRGTKSWHDFWGLSMIVVVWPLGFLAQVGRHWIAALGEWMRRSPAGQAFLGPGGGTAPADPGGPDPR